MVNYIQYLNLPAKIGICIVALFLVIQIVGEILEFKGKIVPEFFKIRKYFARKKQEREAINKITDILKDVVEFPETLKKVQMLLNDVGQHYSADNITKRNQWIDSVNHKLETTDKWMKELDKKLDKTNEVALSLLIDNKRDTIINFASHVIDEKNSVTKEQFNRIFKLYEEYEEIIKENNLTNGEVDIAYRIITESYESHMRNHTFVEDICGYDFK